MRRYQTLINEAELLASSPERVYQWLKDRYAKKEQFGFFEDEPDVDEALEAALLNNAPQLVKLALAKFCFYSETARDLWNKTPEQDGLDSILRLCILSNQALTKDLLEAFPINLFGGVEQLAQWLEAASTNEIYALFQNPKLSDSFLISFLEGDECWQAIDEKRRLNAIIGLSINSRIKTKYDDSHSSHGNEVTHEAVFDAGWKLAQTAPTTEIWAMVLSKLYRNLLPHPFSIENPLALAARWFPDPNGTALSERQSERGGERDDSIHFQGVRTGLAMLAFSKKPTLLPELLDSKDPAYREAAYKMGNLSAEQILAAYQLDKDLASNVILHNKNIWLKALTREALRDVCYEAEADAQLTAFECWDPLKYFNAVRKDMEKEHPEWFADEQPLSSVPLKKWRKLIRRYHLQNLYFLWSKIFR